MTMSELFIENFSKIANKMLNSHSHIKRLEDQNYWSRLAISNAEKEISKYKQKLCESEKELKILVEQSLSERVDTDNKKETDNE